MASTHVVADDQGVCHVLTPACQREIEDVMVGGAVADAFAPADGASGV